MFIYIAHEELARIPKLLVLYRVCRDVGFGANSLECEVHGFKA